MSLPFAIGLAAGLAANRAWDRLSPRRPYARGYCEGVADAKSAVGILPPGWAEVATSLIDHKTAVVVVGFEVEHELGDTSAAPRAPPPADDLTVVGG